MQRLNEPTRQLTHDELKAAEAAFQGWQFNDAWSKSALDIYIGIRLAIRKANRDMLTVKVHSADPLTGSVQERINACTGVNSANALERGSPLLHSQERRSDEYSRRTR